MWGLSVWWSAESWGSETTHGFLSDSTLGLLFPADVLPLGTFWSDISQLLRSSIFSMPSCCWFLWVCSPCNYLPHTSWFWHTFGQNGLFLGNGNTGEDAWWYPISLEYSWLWTSRITKLHAVHNILYKGATCMLFFCGFSFSDLDQRTSTSRYPSDLVSTRNSCLLC